MPRMPFIGVRISWLMLARNSLLARLAASAASFAFCSSACAFLRSVTSRETPKVPTMRPCGSRNGIFVVDTHVSWPSGQVSFSSTPMIGCARGDHFLLVAQAPAGVFSAEVIEVGLADGFRRIG